MHSDISRRTLLKSASLAVASTSALRPAFAQSGNTIKIGYVSPQTDWSHKNRWETGGDWTKNLIDHPDRGHPYGGSGWPERMKSMNAPSLSAAPIAGLNRFS